jgi:PAS domain-containing protein
VRQLLTAAATGGEQAASYEFPLYTRSGDRRELLRNATTRRDGDGEIVGVLGVGLGMTEALSVQRQRVKVAMWGCMREGVATVEGSDALDGVILECNSAMCNLCGVSAPDQLQGTTLRQILVQSGQDVAQISKSMSHGQILEFCLQGSDDIFKTCEATFMEIPDLNAEESVTRLALVVRDRTWKKELEHQVT